MRKFTLVFSKEISNKILKLSHCYQNIKFFELQTEFLKAEIKFLEIIASMVKNVDFVNCQLCEKFNILIQCFPNIEHVEFHNSFSKTHSFKLDPKVLNVCKSVSVKYVGNPSGFYFLNVQLTKLDVSGIEKDWEFFIYFLHAQTRLTELHIGLTSKISYEFASDLPQFNVKSLSLSCQCCTLTSKLLSFLDLFKESLNSLSLRVHSKLINSADIINSWTLLDSISKNFKSLNELHLDSLHFNAADTLNSLKKFQSVKEIKLERTYFETSAELTKFFSMFFHLESITLLHANKIFISDNDFLRIVFKLKTARKIIIKDSFWKNLEELHVIVLENDHVKIEIFFEDKRHAIISRKLALKVFKELDLPQERLKMAEGRAKKQIDKTEWKFVRQEDFKVMMNQVELKLEHVYYCEPVITFK